MLEYQKFRLKEFYFFIIKSNLMFIIDINIFKN